MTRPAKRARLDKFEKGLLIASALFVVLVGGLTWWWDEINRDPVVNIPTPVMPNPNALDYYVKAGNALVWRDDDRFSEALRYGELPSLDPSYTPQKRHSPSGHPPMTLKELEAKVKKNQPALAILREGFNYEYREPPARSFNHLYPNFAIYRKTARLLIADGYVKAVNGDWPGATNNYLDTMEMGATCSRGGPLIGGLVGIAIQAIGRGEMWRAVDHLNAPTAKASAKRFESMLAKQPTLADTLEEEKWASQAGIMEVFHMPGGRKAIMGIDNGEKLPALGAMFYNKREVMKHFTEYMDASIGEARKPYALRTPVPMPTDALNKLLLPVMSKASFKWVVTDTGNRLLLTMLALRAYRQEHGAYPATLADLSPKYLTKIPDDPFGRGGPLHYKLTGKTYLLYSIGPDGKDDGGTPIKDAQKPTGTATRSKPIQSGSRGDIVAGVNVQ